MLKHRKIMHTQLAGDKGKCAMPSERLATGSSVKEENNEVGILADYSIELLDSGKEIIVINDDD